MDGFAHPSRDQWKRLYMKAAEINNKAPWQYLRNTDYITIRIPDREEPVYCTVMGAGGVCYGVGVYPDNDALDRMRQLIATRNFLQLKTFEQNCMICCFGNREDVRPPDREVMKKLNLRFRGKNQWIYFRAMEPGYSPWYLNHKQAELMIIALHQLSQVCDELQRGEIQVNFDAGETVLRTRNGKRWQTSVVPMPSLQVTTDELSLTDKRLITKLRQKNQLPRVLELDTGLIPTLLQDDVNSIPYAPRYTVLVDRKNGELLRQDITPPKEAFEDRIVSFLIDFILSMGRPAGICVRDENMRTLLHLICEEIDIRLSTVEEMHATNRYLHEMIPRLTQGA